MQELMEELEFLGHQIKPADAKLIIWEVDDDADDGSPHPDGRASEEVEEVVVELGHPGRDRPDAGQAAAAS